MINYQASIGPFAHNGNSSRKIMYTVLLSLLPALFFACYQFGLPSLKVVLTAIVSAIACEWVCLTLMQREAKACLDGSAILTAVLLAMSLPSTIPLWMVVFASAFAIIVGKQIYGGVGQNLFNPAMLARVMLIVCFPVEMTLWAQPTPISFSQNLVTLPQGWMMFDGLTSATALSPEYSGSIGLFSLLIGTQSGSLGETSALLILLGGMFLIGRKIIGWVIPISFLLGIAIPAAIAHFFFPDAYMAALPQLLSGGAMLGAFYIATDLVTSPTSIKGQWLYGLMGGLLVWLIRAFGSYPEGVAFAVLIMNSASPLIDHYLRPSVFGAQNKVGQ